MRAVDLVWSPPLGGSAKRKLIVDDIPNGLKEAQFFCRG
jgi:hypothetical protein